TPITATSANISNTPYVHNFKHIYKTFKNHIFLYLYSPCEIEKLISQGKNRKLNNKSSTIIDMSNERYIKFIRNPYSLKLKDLLE
ncbi:MAG: Sua5/YciO/YrdC/YwlC family protein, partial [Deferribacterota bacterium]|nr:Sua5/YciO/YrdC/YwlC family protein [Deferribacterota bacterium]